MTVSKYIYSIAIEGFGPGTGASGSVVPHLLRLCMDDVSFSEDPDELYINCLYDFPNSLGVEVNFKTGDVSIDSQTCSVMKDEEGILQRALEGRHNLVIDTLAEDLTASETAIDLTDGAVAEGQVFCIGRECIIAGTKSGSGPYTYTGCTRGVNGTRATTHYQDGDYEVFNAYDGTDYDLHIKKYRRVYILRKERGQTGGSAYTSEEIRFRGFLTGMRASLHAIDLTIESLLDVVGSMQVVTNPMKLKWFAGAAISSGGGSTNGSLLVNLGYPDYDESRPYGYEYDNGGYRDTFFDSGTDNVTRLFQNDEGTILKVHLRQAQNQFTQSQFFDASYYETEYDTPPINWEDAGSMIFTEIVCTDPNLGVGDNTTFNTMPYSNNPFIMALQMLLTTRDTDTTTHGGGTSDYDMGDGRLGLGLHEDDVDVAAFERLAVKYGHIQFNNFKFTEPLNAKEHIQKMFLAIGCFLGYTNTGKITAFELRDVEGLQSVNSVSDSQLSMQDSPYMDYNLSDPYSTIDVEFGGIPNYTDPDTLRVNDRINQQRYTFSNEGLKGVDLTGLGRNDRGLVKALALAMIARWRAPIPTETFFLNDEDLDVPPLEMGDQLLITDRFFTAKDGTEGFTDVLAQVEARREDIATEVTTYRVRFFGEAYDKVGLIAPAVKVASGGWNGTTKEATVEEFEYLDSNTTTFSSDLELFDGRFSKVAILDKDTLEVKSPSSTYADVTVDSINLVTEVITLDSGFAGTLVEGDVIVPSYYADVQAVADSGLSKYAFMATGGELDNSSGGVDDAYEYTYG